LSVVHFPYSHPPTLSLVFSLTHTQYLPVKNDNANGSGDKDSKKECKKTARNGKVKDHHHESSSKRERENERGPERVRWILNS